jgi:hypothetical protein
LARYIRLYKTPETEDSVTMGFSSGIGAAAYDENLHTWLRRQGYKVTEESLAYRASHRYLENPTNMIASANPDLPLSEKARRVISALSYNHIPDISARHLAGIAIPEESVSATHLQVKPDLSTEHLRPLAKELAVTKAIRDHGLRQHYFIDNRRIAAEPYSYGPHNLIAAWSIPPNIILPSHVLRFEVG